MRIISRKLVFSSFFVVALSSRFSFSSKISRIWDRINLPKLTTFERYSRPIRESSQKSRLVEGPCRAHSGAVSYALPPGVPHGRQGATTRKRAEGRRRGLRVPSIADSTPTSCRGNDDGSFRNTEAEIEERAPFLAAAPETPRLLREPELRQTVSGSRAGRYSRAAICSSSPANSERARFSS
jgi:hypothetical protein